MPTAPAVETGAKTDEIVKETKGRRALVAQGRRALALVARRPAVRELLVVVAFCLITALMTWPWVLHLRDAVADNGDPYMIAWTLWWDYHQTFNDPLHLFQANVFYPYQYTLAFSENDYGISLLFFPLFAAGVRTLTVHSVATFLGFAFCGYAAFRLARTLTGSTGAGWVAGVVFAFIPFRFHVLSHLHYLFACWLPLLVEAFILFARARSWRRAAWLGVAFLMNALTCITWFVMALPPLLLTAIFLVARNRTLARDRDFWLRGGVAVGLASLALVPFLLPYYWVTVMYGFHWQDWEYAFNSPSLIHWLAAERRNRVWSNLGWYFKEGHKLFPGLLAPLLAIAAFRFRRAHAESDETRRVNTVSGETRRARTLRALLDAAMVLAAIVGVLAVGYDDLRLSLFGQQILRTGPRTPQHVVAVLLVAVSLRAGLMLRASSSRLSETNSRARWQRSSRLRASWQRSGWLRASWRRLSCTTVAGVGLIWLVFGFVSSLGANFPPNLLLHDYVPLYQSLRIPSRWAMICYVGLALLAGLGALRLARLAARRGGRAWSNAVFALVLAAVAFELHASPLDFYRGAVEPDAVALRLKQTPMRGGLVEMPSGGGLERHLYMLRAADHARPLVNATSTFISPLTYEINNISATSPLPSKFLDLLERIPASYLVVHNALLPPERAPDYENFLARAVASGRLRFVNRFDGRDDLYAVVKTEPNAQSEAALPFDSRVRDLATLIEDDPVNLVGQYRDWSERLYRIHVVATGEMPRYGEFVRDAGLAGRGVLAGLEERDRQFQNSVSEFAETIATRADFKQKYDALDDAHYVERLFANAGIAPDDAERASLIEGLKEKRETRGSVMLKIADDKRLVARERERSLVLLHFFAYLRRNPDDPPDRDMKGFDYWVSEVKKHGGDDLAKAFAASIERKAFTK